MAVRYSREARRLWVRPDNILVIDGWEIDASILREMLDTKKRVLWAFVANGRDLRPIPFDETRVIWLTEDDLNKTLKECL